jgi:hypothetical protein
LNGAALNGAAFSGAALNGAAFSGAATVGAAATRAMTAFLAAFLLLIKDFLAIDMVLSFESQILKSAAAVRSRRRVFTHCMTLAKVGTELPSNQSLVLSTTYSLAAVSLRRTCACGHGVGLKINLQWVNF